MVKRNVDNTIISKTTISSRAFRNFHIKSIKHDSTLYYLIQNFRMREKNFEFINRIIITHSIFFFFSTIRFYLRLYPLMKKSFSRILHE